MPRARLLSTQLTLGAVLALSCAALSVIPAADARAGTSRPASSAAATVPRPDHTVIVLMENHSYADVIGSSSAPYLNSLVSSAANFTQSFGVTHPSEPNYLALFSGSTQGLTSDSCPHTYSGANLGSELIGKQLSFTGYSESMPSNGYTGCTSGTYARKHNPWVNFTNVPAASNLTFASFPTTYTSLPTVSVVVPNLQDDMHDGTVAQGDAWLQQHLDGYVQWARTHNSLLVLTWDEDDNSANNQIPTLFVGAGVKAGTYSETINHYNVLRTIEDAYGLPYAGASATASPITDAWGSGGCSGQKLGNPGFETGTAAPWSASTGVVSNSAGEPAHAGTWDAWLDGYGTTHTDTLSQTITIPAGCHATLSYWLHIDTAETSTTTHYDTLAVKVNSTTLASYSNLNHNSGYGQHSHDLSAYAGQTVTISFTAKEDSTLQTSFVLDDITVTLF
jgi:hypothetical protein